MDPPYLKKFSQTQLQALNHFIDSSLTIHESISSTPKYEQEISQKQLKILMRIKKKTPIR